MKIRNTVDILGIPIDNVTMGQALKKVEEFLAGDSARSIFTPNAEMLMEASRRPDFKEILQHSDLVIPDGAGVILAAKILGNKLQEKVSGVDLTEQIFRSFGQRGLKVFLFGAKPGVADLAAKNIEERFTGIKVVGTRDGYGFSDEEVLEKINQSGAEVLLVALAYPRQEMWISRHQHELAAKVCIGVGGTIDIFAGTVKKAPEVWRKHGLEWLYRLMKQPSRFRRQLNLPLFILKVLGERFR